jgi:Skp family chaperone for outer membrane proteins
MNFSKALLASLVILTSLLMGCSQPDDDSLPVVVIDLEEIASAIGEDVVIQEKMESAREELNSQLSAMADELEAMLADEKAKLAASPDPAQQEAFENIQLEARQQFAQAQQEAQQEGQRFQAGLLTEFHQQVKPVAAKVSAQLGARITLLADPSAFWFDGSVDITAEVIAALQAEMGDGAANDTADSDSAED